MELDEVPLEQEDEEEAVENVHFVELRLTFPLGVNIDVAFEDTGNGALVLSSGSPAAEDNQGLTG